MITNNFKNFTENNISEETLYNMYMEYKIKKGLSDIENGRVKTTEEVRKILNDYMGK